MENTGEAQSGSTQEKETAENRAIRQTLQRLASVQADLLKAGVTEEQIQTARREAENRIRAEYKELANRDPLSRIEAALKDSAQTEVEQKIVAANLRSSRRDVLVHIAKNSPERGGQIEWKRVESHRVDPYQVVPILNDNYRPEDRAVVGESNPQLQERFLRNLGVLQPDQTLKDLLDTQFPDYSENEQRVQSEVITGPRNQHMRYPNGQTDSFITFLPTNIDGVEARVNRLKPEVDVLIAPSALKNIQPAK